MLGTGLGHYIPIVIYVGFWAMSLISLAFRPLWGFYYLVPFLPYRTLRDKMLDFPLGANMFTILLLCVIVGAILRGCKLPKSKLYWLWLMFGTYLYFSMWVGVVMKGAPLPLWLNDVTFVTWKDYMVIPLVFVAAGLVVNDRKSLRTTLVITAIALAFIDRSCILESMSRTWSSFDENKRSAGPLAFGSNQTSAFLVQFAMFFWGIALFMKRRKIKIAGYVLVGMTLFAAMYTFSRAGYLSTLCAVLLLAVLKERKLLIVLGVFLITWQTVVPTAVLQRVKMTDDNGQLDASAQERVDLWENAERAIIQSPIVGQGFATFQLGEHVDNLKDTHNWYVKVLVESGIIGFVMIVFMIQQMIATAYRLYRRADDPLFKGLGLGLLLATCACLVANVFGDRWTYLEIMGLLWVQFAVAIRALEMCVAPKSIPPESADTMESANPYLAYH